MRSVFFLAILLITIGVKAQNPSNFIYGGISSNAYKGDLASSFDKWTSIFHFGIMLNRKEKVNGNINIGFGVINGQNVSYTFTDIDGQVRVPNRFFKSEVITVNYDFNINLIKKEHLSVFISQGIGIIKFNPKDSFDSSLEGQLDTRASNEVYGSLALMLPHYLGITYTLKNNYGVTYKVGFLNPMTDYIDNISEWGEDEGNDNLMSHKLTFLLPLHLPEKE